MTAVLSPPGPAPDPKPLVLPGRSVDGQILVRFGWAGDVHWTNPDQLARLSRDMTVADDELPGRRETS
ncbi:MAG TPA: hypothetical protein VGR06_41085 [Actinophytocola sp.]|uniref:hypothetical protein n=1 Tax=Actinophytocola sp. TaxID=1872138 RepID=UPI002DFE58CD|nr:hypothetical protein [Actinophytocola sp.]